MTFLSFVETYDEQLSIQCLDDAKQVELMKLQSDCL